MPERLLTGSSDWLAALVAMIAALWGGMASYFRRIESGERHSWISAFMHMTMSGFAGLLCWLGCLQFNVPDPITAICTGLSGHMGAEAIRLFEARLKQRLRNLQ